MSLKAELELFDSQVQAKCTRKRSELLQQSVKELEARMRSQEVLQQGDRAPDCVLLNAADGKPLRLYDQLESGPVVLSFYRGGWSPYCALELRAYQQALGQIRRYNASLIAVSPQTIKHAREDLEQHLLEFIVACDAGNRVARSFGIDYQLTDSLRQMFTEIGHPLPEFNGDDSWRLPIPATFIILPDKCIELAHIDADYCNRLEPADAVAALAALDIKTRYG